MYFLKCILIIINQGPSHSSIILFLEINLMSTDFNAFVYFYRSDTLNSQYFDIFASKLQLIKQFVQHFKIQNFNFLAFEFAVVPFFGLAGIHPAFEF